VEFERGYFAGLALRKRIEERVLAEVRATMPGAPADLVGAVAGHELGERYYTPGTDWEAVEEDRIGD
jgi:hypothetical protein